MREFFGKFTDFKHRENRLAAQLLLKILIFKLFAVKRVAMTNVILCGGSGTRLWPLSRQLMPKQFIKFFSENDLNLSGENSAKNAAENSCDFVENLKENSQNLPQKSLFQLCIQRNQPLCEKSLIIVGEEQYFLALDQMDELCQGEKMGENANLSGKNCSLNSNLTSKNHKFSENSRAQISPTNLNSRTASVNFLLEPLPKNTAAAITLGVLSLPKDEICLVTPSDHLIKNQAAYEKVIIQAAALAAQDFIVTLGIKPSFAQTGFGYIKVGANGDVVGFFEKPNLETAQSYIKQGNFFWNSGIFVFRAEFFLKQMQKFAPEILKAAQNAIKNDIKNAIKNAKKEPNLIRIKPEFMSQIPENSIDYALMEHSNALKLVRADFAWSDVGSFEALRGEFAADTQGNVIKANALLQDSCENFVFAQGEKLIAATDIKNLIIIDTPDALLVCPRNKAQRVKDLVSAVQGEWRKVHTTAHRPWGSYTVLESAQGYKLKRLVVKPGKQLSLQKHFHRSEHWIVVSGTASVTVGDERRLVHPNESTYIKMGQLHRLANEGKIPLVIVEVQVGEYTGEDDIVRVEDDFRRC